MVEDTRAIAKKRGLTRFMHKYLTDDLLDDCKAVILGERTDAQRTVAWRTPAHKLPF